MIGYSTKTMNEINIINADHINVRQIQQNADFETVIYFGKGNHEFQLFLDTETTKKLKEALQ